MSRRNNGEGSFRRKANGTWLYRVEVDGRRVSGTGRTKTDAKRIATERARVLGERRTTDTVRDLYDDWCRLTPEAVGLAPTTRDQYRYLVGKHVMPTLGNVKVEALTRRKVADTVNDLGGSQSTRRSTYAALVRLLDYAVDRGMMRVNVGREVPRPAAPRPEDRKITPDAARKVIEAANGHRLGLAALLGFGCGLRRGEMLALRWADVDLEGGVLTISGNVTRSSAGLKRGTPKTRRGVRQVPLAGVVIAGLKAHRRQQAAERLAAGVAWTDLDLVLTNEIGTLVEPRELSRAWRGWARKAKVKDTGTHLGRHYAATTMLASGTASVADVAAVMGHDPAVLLNTYATAVATGQRAAADVLGDSLAVPVLVPVEGQSGRTSTDSGGRKPGKTKGIPNAADGNG